MLNSSSVAKPTRRNDGRRQVCPVLPPRERDGRGWAHREPPFGWNASSRRPPPVLQGAWTFCAGARQSRRCKCPTLLQLYVKVITPWLHVMHQQYQQTKIDQRSDPTVAVCRVHPPRLANATAFLSPPPLPPRLVTPLLRRRSALTTRPRRLSAAAARPFHRNSARVLRHGPAFPIVFSPSLKSSRVVACSILLGAWWCVSASGGGETMRSTRLCVSSIVQLGRFGGMVTPASVSR